MNTISKSLDRMRTVSTTARSRTDCKTKCFVYNCLKFAFVGAAERGCEAIASGFF